MLRKRIPAALKRFAKAAARGLAPKLLAPSVAVQSEPNQGFSPEWEYRPNGWQEDDGSTQGWNVPSVAETQRNKWPSFLASLHGPGPLGVSHESPPDAGRENRWAHNLIISYGYVLALAARQKRQLSILDWGGGIGHYLPISQALVPDLEIDYICQEVPILARVGRELQPEARFFDKPDECFLRTYDLVVAGSSLWYVRNWKSAADKLAQASSEYLYVTRMMFVRSAESYVAVQRPTAYGYLTKYQFWVLNQNEFIEQIEKSGMSLVREFIFGDGPQLPAAPEQGTFRGFLFRRNSRAV